MLDRYFIGLVVSIDRYKISSGGRLMQISSRFTVALHIFTCVDTFKGEYKITSDFLASSINTNPVIIRNILTKLKTAGLITVARGTGGITLTRPLSDISFYDVYQAIEPVENGELFHFHEAPNPNCPVGKNIHGLLDGKLKSIQSAMENEMKKYTLADLHTGMQELLKKEA
jgi:transcriptional regulator, Rrf2 family